MQGILSHASNLSRFPGFGAVESQEAEELVNTLGLRGLPSDRQKVLNLEPAVESFILGYDADVFKSRHREAERMRARRNETNEARGRARKFAREAEQYRREAALAGRTADQQEQSGLRAFRIGPFNPASILDLFR